MRVVIACFVLTICISVTCARRLLSSRRHDDEGDRSYAVSPLKLDTLAQHEYVSNERALDHSGMFTSYIERVAKRRKKKGKGKKKSARRSKRSRKKKRSRKRTNKNTRRNKVKRRKRKNMKKLSKRKGGARKRRRWSSSKRNSKKWKKKWRKRRNGKSNKKSSKKRRKRPTQRRKKKRAKKGPKRKSSRVEKGLSSRASDANLATTNMDNTIVGKKHMQAQQTLSRKDANRDKLTRGREGKKRKRNMPKSKKRTEGKKRKQNMRKSKRRRKERKRKRNMPKSKRKKRGRNNERRGKNSKGKKGKQNMPKLKRRREEKKGKQNTDGSDSNRRRSIPNPYVKNHELNGKETPFRWKQPYYPFYKKEDGGKVWKEMTDMPVNEKKNLYPLSSFINLENEGLKEKGNEYTHDCGKDGKERNTGLCELLNDGDFDCKTIEVKDGKGKRRKVDISSPSKKITFVALGCFEKDTCSLNDKRANKLLEGMKTRNAKLVLDVYDHDGGDDHLNMIELKVWCEKEGKRANMYYELDHQKGLRHSLKNKLLPKLFDYMGGDDKDDDEDDKDEMERHRKYNADRFRRRRRRLLQYGRSRC